MKKKKKSKSASIFPQETGENKMPSPALQSPANAAAMASGYAGLGAVGSINEEEWMSGVINEAVLGSDLNAFLDHLRNDIWRSIDAD